MEVVLIGIFILSAFFIVYHHAGYPVILRWWANRHPIITSGAIPRGYRCVRRDRVLPTVTIIIPAYNEAQWIADKVRNCASLDYPRDKLKIVIIDDGSEDSTLNIAESTIQEAICADTHFEIISQQDNTGKVAILNRYIPKVDSDITCISDVSAIISVDALLIASEFFKDQNIGVVNSTYQLLHAGQTGESDYWQYQNNIKYRESTMGSTIGAHGALYFIRTPLFELLPDNTINDDFIIPMRIVRHHYQAAYAPNMNAIEQEPTESVQDFRRRLRISAGNMQQVIMLFDLFSPQYGRTAFTFFSGKGLRLFTPYLMITCLISSLWLAQTNAIFLVLFYSQVAVYVIAAIANYCPPLQKLRLIRLITYLIVGHTANLIGGLRYLFGLENGKWQRLAR